MYTLYNESIYTVYNVFNVQCIYSIQTVYIHALIWSSGPNILNPNTVYIPSTISYIYCKIWCSCVVTQCTCVETPRQCLQHTVLCHEVAAEKPGVVKAVTCPQGAQGPPNFAQDLQSRGRDSEEHTCNVRGGTHAICQAKGGAETCQAKG